MSTPTGLISLKEFNEMKNSFNNNISTNLGSNKTDSIWFDFDNLKEYFAYIENEAKANSIDISGIRFHMIAMKDGDNELTIAMSPTFNDGREHIDFDPTQSSDKQPATFKSLEGNTSKANRAGGIMNKGVRK